MRNRPSRPTRMPGPELLPGRMPWRREVAESRLAIVQCQAPAGLALVVDDAAGDRPPGLEPDGHRTVLPP